MARRLDLNRMRKIYPQKKSVPRYFNQTNEVQTHVVDFNNSNVESLAIGIYSYPVIVLGKNDNVNVWISKLYREDPANPWRVDIMTSAAFTGKVYVHVQEGT